MAVRFACPICRREMLLEPVHEGFEVPCPHCGAQVPVPPGAASAPVPSSGGSAHTGDAAFCGTPLLDARLGVDPAGSPVPPPRRPPSEADGSLPLVFGILGLVGTMGAVCVLPCFGPLALFAPIAWWLGQRGRTAALSEGREPPGPVTAGWVLGIVGTCLIVLGGIAFALLVALAVAGSR